MDALRSLRILVVAQIALMVVAVLLGLALEGTLPDQLRSWLEADSERSLTAFEIGILVSGGILLALYAAAWIHLWHARRLSRLLYTAATGGGFLFTAMAGPYVMTGVESAIETLGGIAAGFILGILYFSDLSRSFGAPRLPGAPPPDDDLIG